MLYHPVNMFCVLFIFLYMYLSLHHVLYTRQVLETITMRVNDYGSGVISDVNKPQVCV